MFEVDDKRLESWTKTVAFAAVFVYACGYVIISIRNANFGFSAGDIVKPRVLAAGTTFALLSVFPIYFAHKTFPLERSKTAAERARTWIAALAYFIEIATLILVQALFVHADPIPASPQRLHPKDYLELLGSLSLIGTIFYLYHRGVRHIEKHPNLVTVSCMACFVGELFIYSGNVAKGDSAITLWLLVIGILGCWIYRRVNRKELGLGHLAFVTYAFLIGVKFYADLVFPHIYQRWGGGQPIPIAVSLFDKASNKSSELQKAELIDEESAGIFVQYRSQDVVVFVPKDNIVRICYLENAQPHELSEVMMPSLLFYIRKEPDIAGCNP